MLRGIESLHTCQILGIEKELPGNISGSSFIMFSGLWSFSKFYIRFNA